MSGPAPAEPPRPPSGAAAGGSGRPGGRSVRATRSLRALLRQPSDSGEQPAAVAPTADATAPALPAVSRRYRFSLRLYGGMIALFVVLFGASLAVDVRAAAGAARIPAAELLAEVRGSPLYAAQAGGCLARAGYCMLALCLSAFLLAIPFSANFYTPKFAEIYLADRTNQAMLALGILASANTHFQTTFIWDRLVAAGGAAPEAGFAGFYPSVALGVNVLLLAAAWGAILPYAFYAWRFLTPDVLIERLEVHLVRDLTAAARPGLGAGAIEAAARRARQGILDLANLALRAVDRADRDLSLDGVRALGRSYLDYLDVKARLPAAWFQPERHWFTGLSDEAYGLIVRDRSWVGHLLLHQTWLTYAAALTKIPDAAPAIGAIITRIGGEAARRGDWPLLRLGQRFANNLLREAVKRAEPRVVQGVLYGYRDLLARLARVGDARALAVLEEATAHLRYYAEVAWAAGAVESGDVIAAELARTVDLCATEAPQALGGATRAFEALRVREGASRADLRAAARAVAEAGGREAFGFEAVR